MKIQSKAWWALVTAPDRLPVLFATREEARSNADDDEQLVRVRVCAAESSHAAPQRKPHARCRDCGKAHCHRAHTHSDIIDRLRSRALAASPRRPGVTK